MIHLEYIGTDGAKFDTTPQVFYHIIGNGIKIGKIRDSIQQYLCYFNWISDDTTIVYVTALGKSFSKNASLINDSIILVTSSNGSFDGGILITQADTDNIDDILFGFTRNIIIYKGGKIISSQPTYYLINPMNITTINFGNAIIPIGHAVNPEYTSVLVTARKQ